MFMVGQSIDSKLQSCNGKKILIHFFLNKDKGIMLLSALDTS